MKNMITAVLLAALLQVASPLAATPAQSSGPQLSGGGNKSGGRIELKGLTITPGVTANGWVDYRLQPTPAPTGAGVGITIPHNLLSR